MSAGDVRSYRDLAVWNRAMQLARAVYRATDAFPDNERFGLTNQMRRAAVSVPSNIAEGHARSTTADFLRFVSITLGSLAELETQVFLAIDLGYVEPRTAETLLDDADAVGRMLRKLQLSLAHRPRR